ncbi:hypothetical protein BABINDRAFT_160139 [Babjeviella inositovora NRRL Y-12698]|uniref:Uncharacterized protein n=1 Tax=Babjeviella inositovora NRRL Y-12698 TaxID=984486 RepID=A0A1E3QW60_9ASCO|nr:uncharacterized protein BABINDRAFT_160139 [Babjeviella inositovora NRRL Y-12698]ODQ81909.1 hypothetical protein BABINDRAFT_160139 [Babjeviella inositovora NRRL Y-12698]
MVPAKAASLNFGLAVTGEKCGEIHEPSPQATLPGIWLKPWRISVENLYFRLGQLPGIIPSSIASESRRIHNPAW